MKASVRIYLFFFLTTDCFGGVGCGPKHRRPCFSFNFKLVFPLFRLPDFLRVIYQVLRILSSTCCTHIRRVVDMDGLISHYDPLPLKAGAEASFENRYAANILSSTRPDSSQKAQKIEKYVRVANGRLTAVRGRAVSHVDLTGEMLRGGLFVESFFSMRLVRHDSPPRSLSDFGLRSNCFPEPGKARHVHRSLIESHRASLVQTHQVYLSLDNTASVIGSAFKTVNVEAPKLSSEKEPSFLDTLFKSLTASVSRLAEDPVLLEAMKVAESSSTAKETVKRSITTMYNELKSKVGLVQTTANSAVSLIPLDRFNWLMSKCDEYLAAFASALDAPPPAAGAVVAEVKAGVADDLKGLVKEIHDIIKQFTDDIKEKVKKAKVEQEKVHAVISKIATLLTDAPAGASEESMQAHIKSGLAVFKAGITSIIADMGNIHFLPALLTLVASFNFFDQNPQVSAFLLPYVRPVPPPTTKPDEALSSLQKLIVAFKLLYAKVKEKGLTLFGRRWVKDLGGDSAKWLSGSLFAGIAARIPGTEENKAGLSILQFRTDAGVSIKSDALEMDVIKANFDVTVSPLAAPLFDTKHRIEVLGMPIDLSALTSSANMEKMKDAMKEKAKDALNVVMRETFPEFMDKLYGPTSTMQYQMEQKATEMANPGMGTSEGLCLFVCVCVCVCVCVIIYSCMGEGWCVTILRIDQS
jgi:hypothetical protein